MLKIGIIGTESKHCDTFCDLFNNQNIAPNARITHILGVNSEETNRILEKVKIDNIVSSPDEMLYQVDALLIVTRDGNNHLSYAKPFIEAKTAVWIDKPIAVSCEDAKELLELTNNNNTILMGGSCGRRIEGVLRAQKAVENGEIGDVLFATLNFPANMASQYNGLFFYAPHLFEITAHIFGFSPISLYASKISDNNITVILSYKNFNVTLNFCEKASNNRIYIMGTTGFIEEEIDFADAFKAEMLAFIQSLQEKNHPKASDDFIMSTKLINEVYNSIKTGKAILL